MQTSKNTWSEDGGRKELSPIAVYSEATTTTENVDWDLTDAQFSSIISPVHNRLSSGEVPPIEAASIFASLLNAYLAGAYLAIRSGGSSHPFVIFPQSGLG